MTNLFLLRRMRKQLTARHAAAPDAEARRAVAIALRRVDDMIAREEAAAGGVGSLFSPLEARPSDFDPAPPPPAAGEDVDR
jgi:hypothetical protein